MASSQERFGLEGRTRFVDLVCSGLSLTAAAAELGASNASAARWWQQCVGMTTQATRLGGGLSGPVPDPGSRGDRFLTLEERAMIQMGLRQRLGVTAIAELIGRDKSVVSREARRNVGPDGNYYAHAAHRLAQQRRVRPKPFKLVERPGLCLRIEEWMDQGWSPKLISRVLAMGSDGDQTDRVSHETIYQALYVQTRGSLRADLNQKLSLKRKQRQPHGGDRRSTLYRDAFTISQRPAEVADRAVPGHWEGDLMLGAQNKSAIGTLVERSTRFTILLHLPERHTADEVAQAMIREMRRLPEHLRRSITWDRGSELAEYEHIQVALNTQLFFCDPRSPWQRGTNENTNRLLRFWFDKGSDLAVHTAADLRRVQATLNSRPRPTLNLETPAARLNQLLKTAA
jgi:IS30 family transposase